MARDGAVGTIASVDPRRLHPDLMHDLCRARELLEYLLTGVRAASPAT